MYSLYSAGTQITKIYTLWSIRENTKKMLLSNLQFNEK